MEPARRASQATSYVKERNASTTIFGTLITIRLCDKFVSRTGDRK
jgi:hypothetical protein